MKFASASLRTRQRLLTARHRRAARLLALCASLLLATTAWGGAKTDVVRLKNGDRLTGEVKELDRGQLGFDTDATGVIAIEWDKVASLETQQVLRVELISGLRYVGRAPDASASGSLQLAIDDTHRKALPLGDIVRIATIDRGSLWQRLDGYVTAGYDYTKASDLQQFTFTGGIKSRTSIREWSLDAASTLTSQGDAEDTERFSVTGGHRRFLANRRFVQAFATVDSNDELGIDLRGTLGGGYGIYLKQDQHHEWAAFAGLAITRENFATSDSRDSLEAAFGTTYSFYNFDTPKANLDAGILVLPSLTDSGHVRSEANLRSRYEIVEDLFIELNIYGSFDNEPDEEATSETDYGVTTSLGYSF